MLSNIQQRIERSLYERIRYILVREGYWPDITDTVSYPDEAAFDQAIDNIVLAKGFAIEIFGHGSSRAKFEKKTPRISLVSRRILPGTIGNPASIESIPNPEDPNSFLNIIRPFETANMHQDVFIASGGKYVAEQDRIMNAVLYAAFGGQKCFVNFYDDIEEYFFMRQYNYYDLPDSINGIEEKVYSYQVDDIYLTSEQDEIVDTGISPIKDIKVDMDIQNLDGDNMGEDKFHIDQLGIDLGNKRY